MNDRVANYAPNEAFSMADLTLAPADGFLPINATKSLSIEKFQPASLDSHQCLLMYTR